MTKEEARAQGLQGWNIRCNLCGEYPAGWITAARPGWGDLALCPDHAVEYKDEVMRHDREIRRLRTINFEQR